MLLVHKSLAPLAQVAGKEEYREILTGVHVKVGADGKPEFEATDGAVLIRASETDGRQELVKDFPLVAGMSPNPETGRDAIIPGEAWTNTFKRIKKSNNMPILENAAMALPNGDTPEGTRPQAKLATTNLESSQVDDVRTIPGPYPDTDRVFAQAAANKVTATISFDPNKLATVMATMAKLVGDSRLVTLEVHGELDAVHVFGENKDTGYKFAALVMPMRKHS